MRLKPASIEEVEQVLIEDLAKCDDEQIAAFHRYKVEPCYASLVRYGNSDRVVVVARRESQVIYWEDIEEGFNVSPCDDDGSILQHWCNQDDLGLALNSWIDGRSPVTKVGPARPISD